jgi:hypothetical protein
MTRPLFLALLFTVAACSGTVETASQRIPLSSECQTWDASLTPGALCTTDDPNFDGLRYPEQIAHCRRNVSRAEKNRIAAAYEISDSYSNYEFDHLIPLGIGGNDDESNIWPQPKDQALEKDKLEDELYREMAAGTITQEDAVAEILAWQPACAQ